MRCYPTSDENFYINLNSYRSESNFLKKRKPLEPNLFQKYDGVSYIPYWRDIFAPKETILDHELCFKDWRLSRRIRCACLPIMGKLSEIKLMRCFPAGFLPPPKVLSLKQIREIEGTLVATGSGKKPKNAGKGKGKGKGKKGKKGKK